MNLPIHILPFSYFNWLIVITYRYELSFQPFCYQRSFFNLSLTSEENVYEYKSEDNWIIWGETKVMLSGSMSKVDNIILM